MAGETSKSRLRASAPPFRMTSCSSVPCPRCLGGSAVRRGPLDGESRGKEVEDGGPVQNHSWVLILQPRPAQHGQNTAIAYKCITTQYYY